MKNLLTRMINEYDGEENEEFFSPGGIRLAAAAICLVCFGAGLLFIEWRPLLVGLILGYALAALLFRQHEVSVGKLLSGGANADRASRMGYFMRMLIRAAAIYIAVKNPGVSIFGCVAGLLSVPYGIYALAFVDAFSQRKNKKGGKE